MSRRRVVITGLGAITPLGNTVADTWEGILSGRSGVSRITEFDVSDYATQIAGTITGLDFDAHFSKKDQRKFDTFIQYAVIATAEAMCDAGLEAITDKPERYGVSIGAGMGGLPTIQDNYRAFLSGGPRRVSPFFIPSAIVNMASGLVSMKYNLQGPNVAFATACTTGSHSIGYAARSIVYGDADVMIAGGTEKSLCDIGLSGFSAMKALSRRNDAPELACRPWDADRDGFVMSDGAGIVVLESLDHALQRGARIYAEVGGFGVSSDAYHITAPSGKGAELAICNALRDAGIGAESVNYINAHATSTPAGDDMELEAIEKVFGQNSKQLAVSSTKSMTGHMLGAAGAIETLLTVLAIRDQVAPPTINLDKPSKETSINLVPHSPIALPIRVALNNSFGFGGTNATLVLRQFDGS